MSDCLVARYGKAMLENRYNIEKKIGEGGFASVFRAYDKQEKRYVAIKVLKPGILSDLSMVERLRREFKAGTKLDHPNIVKIYDLQITEIQAYVVLEFLDAEPLEDILRKESLPLEKALEYTVKICSALEHMHKMGIFHRDIKPANIMVGSSGPVLMDFNLVFDAELTALTQTHQFVGTPSYMPPEAVFESNSNAQSDVYSLGVVLWQMLTGVEPYGGIQNINDLVSSWRSEGLQSPSELRKGLPQFIDAIVKKATSVDVSTRYKSAKEFARAIKRIGRPAGKARSRSLSSSSIAVPVSDDSKYNSLRNSFALLLLIASFIGAYLLLKPLPEVNAAQPKFIYGLEQIKIILRTQQKYTGALHHSNVSVAKSVSNTQTHVFLIDKNKVQGVRNLLFKTKETKPLLIDLPEIPRVIFPKPEVVNKRDSTKVIFKSSIPLNWSIVSVPAGVINKQNREAAESMEVEVPAGVRIGAKALQISCQVTDELSYRKKLPVVILQSLSPARLSELITKADLERVIKRWQMDRRAAKDKIASATHHLKKHSLLEEGKHFIKYHSHLFEALGNDMVRAKSLSKNLCLLHRVSAFFVSQGSEAPFSYKPNSLAGYGYSAFLLDDHPWPWDDKWQDTIFKKGVADDEKSLIPIRRGGLASTLGFMNMDKSPAENSYHFEIKRSWLRRCKGGRFLLYITLKQRTPEVGVEVTINNGLIFPCWPLSKGDFEARNHFLIDLKASVLKPGRNEFLVRAVAVAPAKMFGTTLVKEIALMPGEISLWKDSFKASFKKID